MRTSELLVTEKKGLFPKLYRVFTKSLVPNPAILERQSILAVGLLNRWWVAGNNREVFP